MSNYDFEQKLTNAAREALKEMVGDYRQQILLSAAENASRLTGEVREISVHDLLRGLQSSNGEQGNHKSNLISRVLYMYALTGLFMGIAGLGWFAFRDVFVDLNPQRQFPLLLSLAGLGVAAVSFLTLRFYQLRGSVRFSAINDKYSNVDSSPTLIGLFISRWQEVELALRTIVGSRFGESLADGPLSILISRLHDERALDDNDVNILRRLLELRNAVIHKGAAMSEANMQAYFKDAERILVKLHARQVASS